MESKNKLWLGVGIALVVIVIIVIIFAVIPDSSVNSDSENDMSNTFVPGEFVEVDLSTLPEWMKIELTDVRTQETFKIENFVGKPIFIESFAVWCPICTAQQQETKTLHDQFGDDIISISLDTDPNEDEQRIREHIEANGFNWYYAVSPESMNTLLVDEFGLSVLQAPQVPMILICQDGSFHKLKNGVKSVSKMQEEIITRCVN